jgi:hypothetical protein
MKLTEQGKEKVAAYREELKAKRKELLDAGKDTASRTVLPDERAIIDDIEADAVDGVYESTWDVTDNEDADRPLILLGGTDFR